MPNINQIMALIDSFISDPMITKNFEFDHEEAFKLLENITNLQLWTIKRYRYNKKHHLLKSFLVSLGFRKRIIN